MEHYLNSKGSIWRKWDLHIHAPGTALNDGFNNDWEGYLTCIESEDVAVIGITDYLSVENYFKVKEYKYKQGRLENVELILPNIELRLQDYTDKTRAVNYHVIFSPDVDSYIETNFLAKLKFQHGDREYSPIKRDLIDLGRKIKNCLSDEEAYREGINQFKADVNEIHKILEVDQKEIFKGKFVTAVANKQTDGASGIRHSQFQGVQENVYKKSQMIFSSRPGDRDYFLKDNCAIGNPKPCIHGSDAHCIENMFKPDQDRFNWIKADPTFEGLMQILTEPEKRVLIQKDHPDSKAGYNVIDKVVFKNNNQFQTNDIHLNSGLNTIIGGKSSGKSLLLYKIASTVSKDEINLRTKNGTWHNNYNGTFIENIEFEVHWKNGQISSSKNPETTGRITYIPQLYINSLSEDSKNDVLQEKILEILQSDEEISNKVKEKNELENQYRSTLNTQCYLLSQEINNISKISEEIRKYQKQDIYEAEKEKLELELAVVLEESKMTPEDEQRHQQLLTEYTQLIETKQMVDHLKDEYNQVNTIVNSIEMNIENQFEGIQSTQDEVNSLIEKTKLNMIKVLNESKSEIGEKINALTANLEQKNQQLNIVINESKEIESKYSKGEKINILREAIKVQEMAITNLIELKEKENKINDKIEITKTLLLKELRGVFENQLNFINLINDKNKGSLKVKADVIFNQDNFRENFIENFNLRKSLSLSIPLEIVNEERNFIYSKEQYLEKIKQLMEIVINLPTDRFKSNFDLSRVLEDLLKLYTDIVLDVEKDNDIISQMSPGKRGLVLLELFLSISSEKHPILIDQPEDNLDNRTISTELVKFVREKSEERQIILVTHNANLVILTDSDNVIVANQDPALEENMEYRFEYLTGALECSFDKKEKKLISQGIRNHACSILEGGKKAFELREMKYGFSK